jgi:serine/threonine protein kinase
MPSIALGIPLIGPNNETFKTIDFLGKGAFGEVYRAAGQETGSVVAVKLLPLGELASDDSRIALLNEIRAAQQIKHPNVVQVLHVNDGNSSQIGPYVVMEYVSGGTLGRTLRAQKQSGNQTPLNRAIEMMIDIAQGTRAINTKVIHRDIKPDNILIEGSTLKIGDFGISKFVDESTRAHTFKGGQHMAYMAPEAWQNQANTYKLDVYSVGLVFCQILTLDHPLLGGVQDPSNFLDWQKAHLYQDCPDVRTLRKDVPLSIAQLLSRMVSKRPNDRPSWDDALGVLSQPEVVNTATHPSVRAAVEAALVRQQEMQRKELAAMAQHNERQRQLGLYRYSCETLFKQLEPLVEEFNKQFQQGRITVHKDLLFASYIVPSGREIIVRFFEPGRAGIKITGGEVMGGGWIGLSKGRSANLVLLKLSPDDLYGRWVVCEIRIMALADVRKLIGRFGITASTVTPFGFSESYFYDQIQYARGGLHAFTYAFADDVGGFFANLLLEGCE